MKKRRTEVGGITRPKKRVNFTKMPIRQPGFRLAYLILVLT